MTAGALDGKTPLLIARCLFVKYIVKYLQISLLWLILFKVVTGSAIKSPRYSDPEEYNTHVFDELPDKQDGFVTIDLSDDNNDSKKPNGGGINIVVKNFEASNNVVNQSLESICEKEELLIENDEEHDQQLQNNKHKSDLPSNHAHENIQSESESNKLKDKDNPSGQHVSDNTSGQHVSDNNKHDAIPGDTNSITSETEEITKMWHWGKIFYLIYSEKYHFLKHIYKFV